MRFDVEPVGSPSRVLLTIIHNPLILEFFMAKKKASRSKNASKRTLISPQGDKRYVRRDSRGRIKESDDMGRSLAADRRTRAKRKAPKGQKDRGD